MCAFPRQEDHSRTSPQQGRISPNCGFDGFHEVEALLCVIYYGTISELPEEQKMPAYADLLTAQEAEAVLIYIKTFWSEQERAMQ